MNLVDAIAIVLICAGVVFFVAGSAGLLRFPDMHTRLHALTKADNLGLGLVALGVAIRSGDGWIAAKVALVWLLVVMAAATVSQLVARSALPGPDERASSE